MSGGGCLCCNEPVPASQAVMGSNFESQNWSQKKAVESYKQKEQTSGKTRRQEEAARPQQTFQCHAAL